MKGLTVSEILRKPWLVSPNMIQPVSIGTCLVGDYLSRAGLYVLRIGPFGDFHKRAVYSSQAQDMILGRSETNELEYILLRF